MAQKAKRVRNSAEQTNSEKDGWTPIGIKNKERRTEQGPEREALMTALLQGEIGRGEFYIGGSKLNLL